MTVPHKVARAAAVVLAGLLGFSVPALAGGPSPGPTSAPTHDRLIGATGPSAGYWLESGDGGVFAFGAPFEGSATQRCSFQCWGFAATGDGGGYWIADSAPSSNTVASALYGFGDAVDVAGLPPGVTALASTPSGRGGWALVGNTGVVVPFGDARWFGDGARLGLSGVTWPPFGSFIDYFQGIAASPDGGGYWLVGVDGGVFAYGDAAFYGSMGGRSLAAPVDGIAAPPDGHGYWLVAYDGGVFAFGDATFDGSMGGHPLNAIMTGIAADPVGVGYWTVGLDGGVFAFGDAPYLGSMAEVPLNQPVHAIAATTRLTAGPSLSRSGAVSSPA